MKRKWNESAYIAYYGMTQKEIAKVVMDESYPPEAIRKEIPPIFDKPIRSVLQMKNHLQRYI
jgi:hypothetical protein